MENIKVSVIIPVYNVEKYIEECIVSIINQTYKNIEVLVINDGTKDKSIEIIEKYKDKRIKIINKENGGLSSARNKGIEEATGDYILHVDGDDFIKKDAIEQMINKILEQDNIDVVVGDLILYSQNQERIWVDSLFDQGKLYSGKDYLERYFFVNKGCYSSCNKLWKKELYIKNNIRHPIEISLGEDSNTVVRLMYNAKKVIKLNNAFYYYRMHDSSMTKKIDKNNLDYYTSIVLLKKYFREKKEDEFFEKYELSYKFFTLYYHILKSSYKYLKENNLNSNIKIKKMFEQDIKKINKEKFIKSNISCKLKIFLRLYNQNFELIEKLLYFFNRSN